MNDEKKCIKKMYIQNSCKNKKFTDKYLELDKLKEMLIDNNDDIKNKEDLILELSNYTRDVFNGYEQELIKICGKSKPIFLKSDRQPLNLEVVLFIESASMADMQAFIKLLLDYLIHLETFDFKFSDIDNEKFTAILRNANVRNTIEAATNCTYTTELVLNFTLVDKHFTDSDYHVLYEKDSGEKKYIEDYQIYTRCNNIFKNDFKLYIGLNKLVYDPIEKEVYMPESTAENLNTYWYIYFGSTVPTIDTNIVWKWSGKLHKYDMLIFSSKENNVQVTRGAKNINNCIINPFPIDDVTNCFTGNIKALDCNTENVLYIANGRGVKFWTIILQEIDRI